ncbi:MAG: IS3 family transposase [Candidatus Thiodiazotropha sp. (ex. Lucinisca nassula)]|nr:IS3 family transposase [Candidatus Thiodiazotropha sp. (ex. Lucinisca nassula)]MBW9275859.1 IS3 family transposase [Candidatus Thiodiazotropha sp. (ex. Lucinisca nassula)]
MSRASRYSPEFRERAVRMLQEQQDQHASQWAALNSIAGKVGCTAETLRKWVKQADIDQGMRAGLSSSDRQRLKELERENRELKQANEILRKASAFFGPGGARPPTEEMIAFIDAHKDQHGIEPMCKQLPMAVSTYYEHKDRESDPDKASNRSIRDRHLKPEIQRVWDENLQVYGVRKVWRQLKREGFDIARCTVERLMKQLGIQGISRGGAKCWTTIRDENQDKPSDLVNRQFVADRPNQLWVADITFVATWSGFVYVAFVIDVYARSIVGWRVSRSLKTALVLDALEQAIWVRKDTQNLIHHSDRGSQYLSIRYSERLAEAGIESSVGSVGDSYDNALAETINGLYKTEIIRNPKRGPWKTIDDVEYATLEWVEWFNNRRLLEPIGNIPPMEYEKQYYDNIEGSAMAA